MKRLIEAVGASMSIPGLFKPLKLKGRVQSYLPKEDYLNVKYYGMIVDGGMLNNYPINAFNGATMTNDVSDHGASDAFILQSPSPELEPFEGKFWKPLLSQQKMSKFDPKSSGAYTFTRYGSDWHYGL
jgi:predicted acylesterase/phospholipase RssA